MVNSLGIVSKIKHFYKEKTILVRYEELKLQIRQDAKEHMEKSYWIRQFKSDIPLYEHLKRYFDLQQAFIVDEMMKNFSKEE